ncbi:serine kinase [Donghicola sp. C2-DW-16]|uniref:Serine kinase n=1 Tax=Donghicola mangrovi TaxID=2729614 RepID=A0ABX2PI62_9RHOB|nr:serine kinase [Donghicola mangrovi]NVO29186.1 serine kinase [Donghicola mangrovi]
MHQYLCYGLCFHSEIALPELSVCPNGQIADVVIRRGILNLSEEDRAHDNIIDFAPDGSVKYFWPEVGGFNVAPDGSEVLVEAAPGATDDLLAFPLLGPILSEVLRARGYFVLHAGAVTISGQAVGFMADKGVGKSTTTTMLVSSGARHLTDDLFAIHVDTMLAPPGFGQVKLVAEACSFAPEGATIRPEVHKKIDKTRVKLADFDPNGRFPVSWLFVLERGAGREFAIQPLSAEEALVAIMRFSFPIRFGEEGAAHGRGAVDFLRAAAISRNINVARLEVSNDIADLAYLQSKISTFLNEYACEEK